MILINLRPATEIWTIYRLVSPSGKSYVGQTIFTPEERFKQHVKLSRRGAKTKLFDAFKKYTADSFVIETLSLHTTQEAADAAERAAILQFDCVFNGYNIAAGGLGFSKLVCSRGHSLVGTKRTTQGMCVICMRMHSANNRLKNLEKRRKDSREYMRVLRQDPEYRESMKIYLARYRAKKRHQTTAS